MEFLKKRAIVGIVGGIWAEIPDFDYFLEDGIFHNASWSNIFFLHYSLDKVLPETDLFFAAEIFLLFAVVNLFALALTVESFKRLNEALFGKKEEEDEEEEEEAKEGVEGEGKSDEEPKEEGEGDIEPKGKSKEDEGSIKEFKEGEKEEEVIEKGGSEKLTKEEVKEEEEEEGKD
ncbi:MAG: hypothetical protein JSW00_00440 [Thermoplasmata archaeon]|nr:MAG: hypothetical protein JSW00_00440 [Thermoplasmata archaeon]